jgi:PAS domain S-box-containing protein
MRRNLTDTEYRLLVEHSPVMIWRSGVDTKCDYFNERWLAFTGRTLEQEMGDGWAQGVHGEDFERCISHYLDHFHRRVPFEMEYRLLRCDGVYRWIFDRGVPFSDDNGTFAGYIGSCVDVDEARKAREAERQHSAEQLALARDFQKWILAIVSHDIRNPLGAIQYAARKLQLVADPSGEVGRQAAVVARGVARIQHLVEELLDMSRAREGAGIPIDPKPADLRAICLQVIEELQTVAGNRRIHLKCEVDGRGAWDEHRVLQAISNLASNAVQHGTPGSPVHMRLTGDGTRVAVEVDSKGAIPSEVLPKLFEPFGSRRHHGKGDGLGLGLFITKAIAQAHGGCLEFDSSGGATTFRLVLPRRSAPAP